MQKDKHLCLNAAHQNVKAQPPIPSEKGRYGVQNTPGLAEGQTEGNKPLRLKLGRLLCRLGKHDHVNPGEPSRHSSELFPPSQASLL
jgi:hypothetical protein